MAWKVLPGRMYAVAVNQCRLYSREQEISGTSQEEGASGGDGSPQGDRQIGPLLGLCYRAPWHFYSQLLKSS